MSKRDLTSETADDKFNVEAEARSRGIEPFQVRATTAVNDQLMADIVSDAYRGISQSASMIPDKQRAAEEQRPAASAEVPIAQPPGNIIDRMVDAQDRKDRIAAIRQQMENSWIESRLEESEPRIATEYNPLNKENLEK